MKRVVFALLILISGNICISQTEKKELTKDDCETAAARFSQLLSKYTIEQRGAILEILELWEDSCEENELIQRVKILLDISNNSFVDSAYSDYFKDYIFDYFDRINAAYQDDFQDLYNTNKDYFNYVPLRSLFDDWTWNIAKKLKEQQTHGTSAYLMTVLFTEDIKTFENELKSDAYQKSYIKKTLDEVIYNSTKSSVKFVLNSGIWLPTGDMRWTFSMSPVVGFGANIQINKKYCIELGALFAFWVNNKEVMVDIEDSLQSIKSKYGGTYGIWVHRAYSFDNEYFIDAVGGLAYTNFGTGIEKINTDEEEGTSYYHIGTVDLTFGFNVRKRIFVRHDVGVNFSYHFRPYNLDKRLVTKLGKSSFSLSLFYRF